MKTNTSKHSKIRRCFKATIRVLTQARDLYIRSTAECAGHVGVMGCPTPHISTVPKSFSVNSSKSNNDEDFRELVRAASTRSLGKKIELEVLRRQQLPPPATVVNGVPRSQSVGIGRIDEDEACEFGEEVKVTYPRSRSYAVSKRIGMI